MGIILDQCGQPYDAPTISERPVVQGCLSIQVIHWPTREIIQEICVRNKIVTTGLRYLATLVKGATPAPTDLGVGTDNTAPVAGDTALLAQVFKDSITQRIDITDGVRIRFFLPTTAANGNTLKEAGIFGPSPEFRMLSRATYADIVKTSSIAVNYSWDITFAQP